jgi:uncharacterized surface protein with fasciclin (FAS1) repeats
MTTRRLWTTLAVAASLTVIAAACTTDTSTTSTAAPSPAETSMSSAPDTSSMTVTEIAASNEDFSTLVTAVEAAGLAETLSGTGPLTVFAPTNDAFDALPAGTVETLLKPKNQDQLASVLTYHVVDGEVMAADVQPGAVKTVNGETFDVATDMDGGVEITDGQGNTAMVTTTDIVASNGVIHVIDAVLLPPSN